MTEKRFISKSDYDWWFVKDTTGKFKGEYDDWMSDEEVVDCLNALHEDLETEKQKNRALKTILGCTKMRLKKIIGELE